MLKIPEKELEILGFWKDHDTFKKSLEKESPKGDYVFYDGPPFATGLPHYGHIVASVMKDAVPRYWTMQGYRVERRWGWDCHGLPVENIAEKELKFKEKRDIDNYGVAKFNEYCRVLVMRYVNEWRATIDRIGRWVDLDNDYKTMNPEYMESIWWVFKTLWDKELVYKGYKSMHMCPRCGTTLSNFEVTQNYKDVKDLSVTAKFELVDEPGTFVLAWTTTPWTLLGNVALAVHADLEYVKIRMHDETYILAKPLLEKVIDGQYEVLETISGASLVGKAYKPLFDYFAKSSIAQVENGWKIYAGDFVTTEEGTGVVHIAPAFGEEDMQLGKDMKLPFIQHIDMSGRFKPEVTEWAGRQVKPADDVQATDRAIVDFLQSKNLVFNAPEYTHSYPHCWRCETPLLNYAADSWFVEVTKIKEQLLKNNHQIKWYPEHLRDGRFGKWLEAARDWAISRNRYWGTPLPVWVCDACEEKTVIGSRAELKDLSGQSPEDLHKQFVDAITFACKCGGVMRRIPEVFDCWFESGSMPYAELNYPFKKKEYFDTHFPADFIAEGVDQTRGWFYTLIVLSTALFDKPMTKHVMVNGIVLAADGSKMSKSKKNFPDPNEIIGKYGADALRFYLLSSPVMQAENLNFSENEVREVYNKVLNTLYNTVTFYKLYEDHTLIDPGHVSQHLMDRWIVNNLNVLKKTVSEKMDAYDTVKSTRAIAAFINELSTWYIRRSRDRFKELDTKKDALNTSRTILIELAKVIAPFIPFTAEYVWKELGASQGDSVHLSQWPMPGDIDTDLLQHMEKVQVLVEKAHALRSEAGIKIRQPLAKLEIDVDLVPELRAIIAEEVNVKEVLVGKEFKLDTALTEELKAEGMLRELVRTTNALRKEKGLKPSDAIRVAYMTESESLSRAITTYNDQLCKQTIAESWTAGDTTGDVSRVNGEEIIITF